MSRFCLAIVTGVLMNVGLIGGAVLFLQSQGAPLSAMWRWEPPEFPVVVYCE